MHILYVDGSGTVANPRDHHVVFAGLSVIERGIYHLIKETDGRPAIARPASRAGSKAIRSWPMMFSGLFVG